LAHKPSHVRHAGVRTWVIWLGALAGATALLLLLRARLDKAHVALGFLLVVLGGSSAGGRALGISLAVLAFLSFNFLFLPPYYTLRITDPLDWLVLLVFLITGVVAAQLLNRAEERADMARQRAQEVARLAALGAETLNAGRAEDALTAVAEVIRSAMGAACCEILTFRDDGSGGLSQIARAGECAAASGEGSSSAPGSLAAWVAVQRAIAAERSDGTKWIGVPDAPGEALRWPPADTEIRALLVPLTVPERTVGVLSVSHRDYFRLDLSREQFLSALSFYAALGVDRVRLVADAERAEAFRQADDLKTALVAGVSHDLRTPLTAIKAIAHSLRERGSIEAATIEEEADRLNRMVGDLLDLSRLNAGSMPLQVELNAAEDLVGAATTRFGSGRTGRRMVLTHAPEPVDATMLVGRFDFVQALRALVNLLENADKYSPAEAPIELGVARKGERLEFAVADRGPGVPEGERDRIFEPFYRAPGAHADVGGAGLGLAIARGLAMEQGGAVEYRPRPGGGSVFVLALPAVQTD
jgi:two-component system sensor histidine kinase KdpD